MKITFTGIDILLLLTLTSVTALTIVSIIYYLTKRNEILKSKKDAELFLSALEHPREPNQALISIAEKHSYNLEKVKKLVERIQELERYEKAYHIIGNYWECFSKEQQEEINQELKELNL